MRNLKRALSLALASVMLLGTMVVGSSAKGLDNFSDAATVVNKEAVAVTSSIGIFVGEDGSFMPEKVVTRAEMAVIVVKMLYGADVNIDQFADMASFTDVPAWAKGWTSLAASLGIIVGDGDGTFRPNDPVTTAEASVMLAKTLGYFKNPSVEFGNSWELTAVSKATQLGLFGDMKLTAKAGLTRDNVAEMVFNALTAAVPVQYNELLGVYFSENMDLNGKVDFNYIKTLGYKNFNLVYKTVDKGAYGRPEQLWGVGTYNTDKVNANGTLLSNHVRILAKDEIATTAKAATYSYEKATKEYEIRNAMGSEVLSNYNWSFYVDGNLVDYVGMDEDGYRAPVNKTKSGDNNYVMTDNGAITEIYVEDTTNNNNASGTVRVVKINNYLGEVTHVKTDDKGELVTIKALSADANYKLDDRTFYATGFQKGDIVNFTIDTKDNGDQVINTMKAAATVTGVVSRVEKDATSDSSYIKLEGDDTKHAYAANGAVSDFYDYEGNGIKDDIMVRADLCVYDVTDVSKNNHPELGDEYILYVTAEGFVLGYKVVDASVKQYLYVTEATKDLGDIRAKVTLSDGTTKIAQIKKTVKDGTSKGWDVSSDPTVLNGRVFKYTVSESGIYTLNTDKLAYTSGSGYKIENGKAYIQRTVAADKDILLTEDTIFVDVDAGKTYTGYSKVPSVENAKLAWGYAGSDKTAVIVYILDGEIYDASSLYFVVTSTSHESFNYKGDKYRSYTAYNSEGAKITVNVSYDSTESVLTKGVIYKALKTIDGDYITEAVKATPEYYGEVQEAGNNSFRIKNRNFSVNKDTKVVLVETEYPASGTPKYTVTSSSVSEMKNFDRMNDGRDYYVSVMAQDNGIAKLVYMELRRPNEQDSGKSVSSYALTGNAGTFSIYGAELSSKAVSVFDKIDAILYGNFTSPVAASKEARIYEVTINGTKYIGYCFDTGMLFVPGVVIDADDFANATSVGITLNISNIKATGDVYAVDNGDYMGFTGKVIANAATPLTVNNIVVDLKNTGAANNGYYYSVNSDTSYDFASVVIMKDDEEVKGNTALETGYYTGVFVMGFDYDANDLVQDIITFRPFTSAETEIAYLDYIIDCVDEQYVDESGTVHNYEVYYAYFDFFVLEK